MVPVSLQLRAPGCGGALVLSDRAPLVGCGRGTRAALRRRRMALLTVSASSQRQDSSNPGLGFLTWAGAVLPQGAVVTGVKTGWRLGWETMMRELAPQSRDGEYTRPTYSLNGRISNDLGSKFPVESGRYAVYVGNACPWCHRVALTVAFRGLGEHVTLIQAVDDAERASRGGWVFDRPEPVFNARDLRQVYDAGQPGYMGRCTAPLLVDMKARKLVSNESSDIVRMLNAMHFEGCTDVELLPPSLIGEIDQLNDQIYRDVNNGVYRCGFATSQVAYDKAIEGLYARLEALEDRLGKGRFLHGERLTESDLRLFPTIVRFDAVYASLFKCSRRRMADFPNLSAWMRDIWQADLQGQALKVKDTFSVDDARKSYFGQLFPLNPGGIIPAGPTAEDLRLHEPALRGPDSLAAITYKREGGSVNGVGG